MQDLCQELNHTILAAGAAGGRQALGVCRRLLGGACGRGCRTREVGGLPRHVW